MKDELKKQVAEKKFLDVGKDAEKHFGFSRAKFNEALKELTTEGYKIYYIQVPRKRSNLRTTIKVLTTSDRSFRDVYDNRSNIQPIMS